MVQPTEVGNAEKRHEIKEYAQESRKLLYRVGKQKI
jgi:hypothetical protein